MSLCTLGCPLFQLNKFHEFLLFLVFDVVIGVKVFLEQKLTIDFTGEGKFNSKLNVKV